MVIRGNEFLSRVAEELVSWDDVDHGEFRDAIGMVEGHAVPNASAAIVSDDRELVESEVPHHFHLILRGGAFGMAGMIFAVRRFAAVAIAAKIGGDHRELLGQPRRDLVPLDVRLRKTVEQQNRRTAAGGHSVDGCA